jgi:O-antigen/teichoic acid export membrane protein
MNREFLFNIFLLIFINLLIKPFFIFGIDLTVQNRVPEGDYGLYFTLFNFTYIFQIINDFGIQNFNNKNISQYPKLLPKYFPNLLTIKGILSFFYILFTLLAAYFLAKYGAREIKLLSILLLNQILTQLIFFLRSNISGLGHFRLDSLLSSLDKLLMLLTCGWVLWFNPFAIPFSIEMFVLAQTLALVITALTTYYLLKKRILVINTNQPINQSTNQPINQSPNHPINQSTNQPINKAFLVYLLKKSYPYALVILFMTAYSRLDAIILERMLPDGKYHADVFASGFRILDACNMLGYLFASLLLPMFARLLKNKDQSELKALVSLSFRLIWTASLTLALAVFFSKQELVQLMMPTRASAYRWETLGILIFTFVPIACTYIFSTLLTANENLRQMNKFFIVGVIFDIILNLVLIPKMQAKGAAIAAFSTQLFVACAMIGLCFHTFKWKIPLKKTFKLIFFSISLLLFNYITYQQTNYIWPIKALLYCIESLFLILILQIFSAEITKIVNLIIGKKQPINE